MKIAGIGGESEEKCCCHHDQYLWQNRTDSVGTETCFCVCVGVSFLLILERSFSAAAGKRNGNMVKVS